MTPIALCTCWVCAGTFVDHEWVSASTNIRHEEEILGMELNYKINVPCAVQWRLLGFSAPTRLNKIFGHDLEIKKYHEVVNSAIIDVIARPFGPRSCMLKIGGKGPTQYASELGCKQGDGMRESCTLFFW